MQTHVAQEVKNWLLSFPEQDLSRYIGKYISLLEDRYWHDGRQAALSDAICRYLGYRVALLDDDRSYASLTAFRRAGKPGADSYLMPPDSSVLRQAIASLPLPETWSEHDQRFLSYLFGQLQQHMQVSHAFDNALRECIIEGKVPPIGPKEEAELRKADRELRAKLAEYSGPSYA